MELALSVHTALTCQSAWAVAHSLLGEHVRIMQETSVQVFMCKPRATWNEVGLHLCWKEECSWCCGVGCSFVVVVSLLCLSLVVLLHVFC